MPPTRKETTGARRPTRSRPAVPRAPKKIPMALIIGGSVAGASIFVLIMILVLNGGDEKAPKKKETPAPPITRNTGEKVDEARLRQGIVKCEKAYDLYRELKGRMHDRGGMSTSELQKLGEDLKNVDGRIQAGLADIEYSNGRASVTAYQKAHKDMKMVLMELK